MRLLGAPEGEEDGLALSLPAWPPFPEVPGALMQARGRGWKLAILSNTDRDYIEASTAQLGVPFELAIVASEIGSYKPGFGHWNAFIQQTGRMPDVHVGASLFHDVAPATELGLASIWINRLGERADPEPTRELPTSRSCPRHSTSSRRHEPRAAAAERGRRSGDQRPAPRVGARVPRRGRGSEDEIRSWFAAPGHLDAGCRAGGPARRLRSTPLPRRAVTSTSTCARSSRMSPACSSPRRPRRPGAPTPSRCADSSRAAPRCSTEAFKAAGWKLIRHGFQMRIQLTDDIPEPSWPDGSRCAPSGRGRTSVSTRPTWTHSPTHWGFHRQEGGWRTYTVDHHDFDPSLWWLVDDGDEVAGVHDELLALLRRPDLWLGRHPRRTRRPGEGAGWPPRCCCTRFTISGDRGATRVGLGVDAENTTGAVQLYERPG